MKSQPNYFVLVFAKLSPSSSSAGLTGFILKVHQISSGILPDKQWHLQPDKQWQPPR